MYTTTPIRLFLAFALLALLGFGLASWTAGAVLPVLVGVAAAFAAAVAVAVELDRDGHAPTAHYYRSR